MFRPGPFLSNTIVSQGSSLKRFGQSVWTKNSKVLNSVPPTMNRSRRRKMFFVVLSASGAPAISSCGCARMPNWMLAPGISTRIGPGGGANGTYGSEDGAGLASSTASGGAGGGAGLGAGLAPSGSALGSVDSSVCAEARKPGSDSAMTAIAARANLGFIGAGQSTSPLPISRELPPSPAQRAMFFRLRLRSRSLIACLPSASLLVVG